MPLLELRKREKLITEENYVDLTAELEILPKMLTALIKGTDGNLAQDAYGVDQRNRQTGAVEQ
ncbi:MAG: hypothetical protein HYV05_13790 [Deltaproteobacteria bacterium]|nr:hypothetical protein [Deltaproteobacteria bacterium]